MSPGQAVFRIMQIKALGMTLVQQNATDKPSLALSECSLDVLSLAVAVSSLRSTRPCLTQGKLQTFRAR